MQGTQSILDKITATSSPKVVETRLAKTLADLEQIREQPLNERQRQQLEEVIESYALTKELLMSKMQFRAALQQQMMAKGR